MATSFKERLAGLRGANKEQFASFVRENEAELFAHTYDQKDWSTFINLAVKAGISVDDLHYGCAVMRSTVRNWRHGVWMPNGPLLFDALRYIVKTMKERVPA